MIAELEGFVPVLAAGVVVLAVAVVALAFQLARLKKQFESLNTGPAPVPVPTPVPAPTPVAAAAVAEVAPVEPPTAPEPVAPPEPVEAEEPAEVVPKAKSDLDLGTAIPEELIPILIAAAATAIGKPVRVKDVVLVRTEKPNVWGTQGRIVIQRSHDTASHQW